MVSKILSFEPLFVLTNGFFNVLFVESFVLDESTVLVAYGAGQIIMGVDFNCC